MSINGTARLLALGVAYILASNAWAQKGFTPAPELKAEPIPLPLVGQNVSGLLDIDFRCKNTAFDNSIELEAYLAAYPYCTFYEPREIITISTTGGELTQNGLCVDDQPDPNYPSNVFQDGYGISSSTCADGLDGGIEKGESLVVEIRSDIKIGSDDEGNGKAAFDVNGVWLTDFQRDKNGESGFIALTLVDGERKFSFSWKDVVSENIDTNNPNDEFFVGFGETLRMTKAVISGNVGSFSVAGFSQQPVVLNTKPCDPTDPETICEPLGQPEIARNVRLELKVAQDIPGNRGVKGTLFKEGVYVIPDGRPQCQPGASSGAGNEKLEIDLNGDTKVDLIMQAHQCGYPAAESRDKGPVIFVLDLDGSRLTVEEDTITAIFDDDSNDDRVANSYFCESTHPDFRPGFGWLPKSGNTLPYAEIPVINAAEQVVFDVQDNTVGPCGSSRGSVPRYSYVIYNWVNRVDATTDASYEAIISARIEQLAAFVDDLFVCVQQGVNQSTLSADVGRIRQSFAGGRYDQTVKVIQEMRGDVLDPRLNDEIGAGGCFFDLTGGKYVAPGTAGELVPANAVGNLLVQLDHLDWMVRTTVGGQTPDKVPALGN